MDLNLQLLELKHKLNKAQNEQASLQRISAKESEKKRKSFSETSILQHELIEARKRIDELENQLSNSKQPNLTVQQEGNSNNTVIESQPIANQFNKTNEENSITSNTQYNEDHSKEQILAELIRVKSQLSAVTTKNELLSAGRENQMQLKLEIESLRQQNEINDSIIKKQAKEIVNYSFLEEKIKSWETVLGQGAFKNIHHVSDLEKQFIDLKKQIEVIKWSEDQFNEKTNTLLDEISDLQIALNDKTKENEILAKEKQTAIEIAENSKSLLVILFILLY